MFKWVGLLIVALIALACIAMVAYLLFVMAKRLLIPIFKRTSGAIAFCARHIIFFSALHPFLPRIQSLSKTSVFHTIRLQIFNS